MGRHSVPSTGEPVAALRSKVVGVSAAVVAAVAVAIAAGMFAFGLDDGSTTTQDAPPGARRTAAAPTASSPAPSASASESVAATPSAAATKRPPTLNIRVVGRSFVTVRTPDGRTLVSRLFTQGQHKSFDNKVLRVTIGNSAAVRVEVNGKLLEPGRVGEVAAFTARRK